VIASVYAKKKHSQPYKQVPVVALVLAAPLKFITESKSRGSAVAAVMATVFLIVNRICGEG
jgi:hypothetical protein